MNENKAIPIDWILRYKMDTYDRFIRKREERYGGPFADEALRDVELMRAVSHRAGIINMLTEWWKETDEKKT